MYNPRYNDVKKLIYQSVNQYSKSIVIKQTICISDINVLMQSILDEHPEIFYFDKWNCVISKNQVKIEPLYLYKINEIKKVYEECNKQIQIILSRIINLSEYDQIKRIHDILIRNITYNNKEDSYSFHSIVGPLINRTAVCDGYSRLYKLLLDRLGFQCIVVRGRGFNKTLNDSESHLWNMINYQGKWYHIDITYDHELSLNDFIRYDYFFVDDSVINIDHYYNKQETPKSYDDSMNPYSQVPILKNTSDITDYICRMISLHERDFILRINNFSEDAEKMLNNCFSDALDICNLSNEIEYYYNPTRMIAHIRIR